MCRAQGWQKVCVMHTGPLGVAPRHAPLLHGLHPSRLHSSYSACFADQMSLRIDIVNARHFEIGAILRGCRAFTRAL